MNKSSPIAVRIFAIMLVVYGVINLLGLSNYSDFKLLCTGLPQAVIFVIYSFGIIYGIICILCGRKMLKLENWARKTALIFVVISLLAGFYMNPVAFRNLKTLYDTGAQSTGVSFEMVVGSYKIFAILFAIFEVAFLYFFTRAKTISYFGEH